AARERGEEGQTQDVSDHRENLRVRMVTRSALQKQQAVAWRPNRNSRSRRARWSNSRSVGARPVAERGASRRLRPVAAKRTLRPPDAGGGAIALQTAIVARRESGAGPAAATPSPSRAGA